MSALAPELLSLCDWTFAKLPTEERAWVEESLAPCLQRLHSAHFMAPPLLVADLLLFGRTRGFSFEWWPYLLPAFS